MSSNQVILGIDPGTQLLGYGVISVDDKGPHYLTMGVFDLRKIKEPFEKLANIHGGVQELIETWHPTAMAVESPFYGKNVQVVLKLGRAQGAASIAATQEGIPVTEYAPRKAKIAICGNGAASKEQVSTMIQKTLNVELSPDHLDATDALAIALCHYYEQNALPGVPRRSSKKSNSWEDFLKEHPDRTEK